MTIVAKYCIMVITIEFSYNIENYCREAIRINLSLYIM